MNQLERKELACGLSSLCVFRGLLKQEAMAELIRFLGCEKGPQEQMTAYGAFVNALAEDDYSLSNFLCRQRGERG